MNPNPLDRVARRASENPFFLGFRIAGYADLHELDEAALASRLGCDPAVLADVRLCRAPRGDDAGFREDVLCVAQKFGLNPHALAEAAKHEPADLRTEVGPADAPGVLLAARDREPPP